MAARDALRKVAVDALYDARNDGKVMDVAAEAVMDAVLVKLADHFMERDGVSHVTEELLRIKENG